MPKSCALAGGFLLAICALTGPVSRLESASEPLYRFLISVDAEKWNTWRKANPTAPMDLSSAELGGANLAGFDLRNVNLKNANLQETDLRHADLRHADLRGARLFKTRLEGAKLEGARQEGAIFAPIQIPAPREKSASLGGLAEAPPVLPDPNRISTVFGLHFGSSGVMADLQISRLYTFLSAGSNAVWLFWIALAAGAAGGSSGISAVDLYAAAGFGAGCTAGMGLNLFEKDGVTTSLFLTASPNWYEAGTEMLFSAGLGIGWQFHGKGGLIGTIKIPLIGYTFGRAPGNVASSDLASAAFGFYYLNAFNSMPIFSVGYKIN